MSLKHCGETRVKHCLLVCLLERMTGKTGSLWSPKFQVDYTIQTLLSSCILVSSVNDSIRNYSTQRHIRSTFLLVTFGNAKLPAQSGRWYCNP